MGRHACGAASASAPYFVSAQRRRASRGRAPPRSGLCPVATPRRSCPTPKGITGSGTTRRVLGRRQAYSRAQRRWRIDGVGHTRLSGALPAGRASSARSAQLRRAPWGEAIDRLDASEDVPNQKCSTPKAHHWGGHARRASRRPRAWRLRGAQRRRASSRGRAHANGPLSRHRSTCEVDVLNAEGHHGVGHACPSGTTPRAR